MADSESPFGSSDSLNKNKINLLSQHCPSAIKQLQSLSTNTQSSTSVEPATINDSREELDSLVNIKCYKLNYCTKKPLYE
jgi:hypothetical protein